MKKQIQAGDKVSFDRKPSGQVRTGVLTSVRKSGWVTIIPDEPLASEHVTIIRLASRVQLLARKRERKYIYQLGKDQGDDAG